MTTTSAGLSAVGGGALAGGIAGGAALISGGFDAYNAYKSYKVGDTEKAKAEVTSSGMKIGGVAAGAIAGASIGSVIPVVGTAAGALIGAGLGGIAGWFGGNKVKEDYEAQVLAAEKTKYAIEGAKFETKELQEAFEDTEVSAEEFGAKMQEATTDKIKMHLAISAYQCRKFRKRRKRLFLEIIWQRSQSFLMPRLQRSNPLEICKAL